MSEVAQDPGDARRESRLRKLRRLVAGLALDPLAHDRFAAPRGDRVFDRVYGGHLLAQAMMAGAATVRPSLRAHSIHASYLRLGDPDGVITYAVERLLDSRNFSNRLVRAEQGGEILAVVTVSFGGEGRGFEHQSFAPPTPGPEEAPSREDALHARFGPELPRNAGAPWPLEIRHVDRHPWDTGQGGEVNRLWMRAEEPLPDEPNLHTALLLYASDLTMVEPVIGRHVVRWEDLMAGRGMFGASLDHAFWLHRPVRLDEWVLHVQESSSAADGRAFATGRFFSRDGELVASVAQEMMIRTTT